MFKKLKAKIIIFTTLITTIVIFGIIGVINYTSYKQIDREAKTFLLNMKANNGVLDFEEDFNGSKDKAVRYRYFIATVNENDNIPVVEKVDTQNILDINEDEAKTVIGKILNKKKSEFTLKSKNVKYYYTYSVIDSNSYYLIVLNSENLFINYNNFLSLSLITATLSSVIISFLVFFMADYIVRPFKENYESQKQFITNASHELKTPLAIISGNNEMREIVNGEDEWTESTTEEINRLTNLINQLVKLNKLEERETLDLEEIDVSELLSKTVDKFAGATTKRYEVNIMKSGTTKSHEDALGEILNILLDNANKYSDGVIKVSYTDKKKITISNEFKNKSNVKVDKFFDRFYRGDESHNNEISGTGIGLSMAQSLAAKIKVKLKAEHKNDHITFTIEF